jgi:hypothetical protein
MSIYIYKNNQQSGPFEEAKVLEMLKSGQLSPNDLAVRKGGQDWQKLDSLFPTFGSAAPGASINTDAVKQVTPKKSRKGLLLGCGGFLVIASLVFGILGFLAFRNMNPADSTVDLPNTVKDYKLNNRYPPKGNIWGTESQYVGLYSNSSKTQTVLYLTRVFSDESAAKDAFRSELLQSCKTGETPMYFSFIDKTGNETSEGATCAIPFYVQKDNKLVAIGGSGASADAFIEFAENLPFNEGTTMKKKENK